MKNPTQQAYCCGFCLQWTAHCVKRVVLPRETWKGRPIPPRKAADSTSSEPKGETLTAVREWKRKAYAPFLRTAKIALGFVRDPMQCWLTGATIESNGILRLTDRTFQDQNWDCFPWNEVIAQEFLWNIWWEAAQENWIFVIQGSGSDSY